MRNRFTIAAIALAISFLVAGSAAANNNPNCNLALDMQAKSKTRSCATMATTYTACSVINRSVTVAAGAATLDAIPVAYMYTGMTAIAFGLDWASTAILYAPVWTKCADLEITRIGTTDASFALTWTTCQTPPSGSFSGQALGWMRFNTYGLPGRIHFKNDDGGPPRTVDCSFSEGEICTMHDGFLNGELPGPGDLDPCTAGPSPTERTTWSGVKGLYR